MPVPYLPGGPLTVPGLIIPGAGTAVFGGDGVLYRVSAGVLSAIGSLRAERSGLAGQYVQLTGGDANGARITADFTSQKYLRINNNGAGGSVTTASIQFALGDVVGLQLVAGDKLLFGSAGDTSLYRSAAGVLKTDGGLIVAGGPTQLYAPGATSGAGSGSTNWLRAPQGATALWLGAGADTSGLGVDGISVGIRWDGSGVAWGDLMYLPNGGGGRGHFRFGAVGSVMDPTPSAKVGVGALWCGGTLYVAGTSTFDGVCYLNGNVAVAGNMAFSGNVGFYGTPSIAKPGATSDLKASLVALGLITGGGATPLNLNGGAITAPVVRPIATKTANYALTAADDVILGNATLLATLPSAVTAGAGKEYTLRNIHASGTLSVNSAGGTINGGSSTALGPGLAMRVISDGANWWVL